MIAMIGPLVQVQWGLSHSRQLAAVVGVSIAEEVGEGRRAVVLEAVEVVVEATEAEVGTLEVTISKVVGRLPVPMVMSGVLEFMAETGVTGVVV